MVWSLETTAVNQMKDDSSSVGDCINIEAFTGMDQGGADGGAETNTRIIK